MSRNFYTPKTYVFGAGELNFFRWTAKRFQSPRGRFLIVPNPFWDCVGPLESKTTKIRPQNAFLQKFLHPQIDLFGVGWSKKFRPAPKGVQSPQKKFFAISNPFLRSIGLREPKIANFRPKTEISESHFGRNFCMWVSGAPQKFFPTPATPKVSPKIFLGS